MSSLNDDGLDELVAAADGPLVNLPSAAEVKANANKAADSARSAMGSSRPVDSGEVKNPRLRVLEKLDGSSSVDGKKL